MTNETEGPAGRVLIVDDDAGLRKSLVTLLSRAGLLVESLGDPLEVMQPHFTPEVDVALLDISMPNVSGLTLLRELKRRRSDLEVIMMTGNATVEAAVESLKSGAADFLVKPFQNNEVVVHTVKKACERRQLVSRNRELEQRLKTLSPTGSFVGDSAKMRQVFDLIQRVSGASSTVLLQGESGTGKELAARAIHQHSPRKNKPFVTVNCGALPETLLDSELFGHLKGSFTGAAANRKGLFEAAQGGTLFLDEVGDMPLATQVRLLRAIQEGEVRPVGSNQTIKVDVRVIAATHVDLKQAVEARRFREDLFYRLNVISISLPPLRERPTDIPALAHYFLKRNAEKQEKKVLRISSEAMGLLVNAQWPGNVRELENAIERAVVLATGEEITPSDLPSSLPDHAGGAEVEAGGLGQLPYAQAKRLAISAFDRQYLQGALRRAQGNISLAARQASLDRSNFRRLLRYYSLGGAADKLEPDDDPSSASSSTLIS